jgi:MFS family permease
MLLLGVGCFFAAGTTGPTGAMVARLTHESIRATAFGTYTLFNNLLGLAAGPLITGVLADRIGLESALRLMPLISIAAIVFLFLGRAAYPASLRRLETA